ncbi:MAG: hypothetical protein HY814_15485 [Candidatus Riflebacteria bacterium]|nr:hypothetical protein [Candidatus Riflebacteria bacterium]
MNFYLIPGDNEEPISCLATSPDGSHCLAGTSQGSLFRYDLDLSPLEPLALPRRYSALGGLAFTGTTGQALALARNADGSGDILLVHPEGGVELLYADAPHPLSGLVLSVDGSMGLMCAGGVLLRYYPEEKSYLPVDTPEEILLMGAAFLGSGTAGLVVGGSRMGGFVGRFEPTGEGGKVSLLSVPPLPELRCVASNAAGQLALAGGRDGALASVDSALTVRPRSGLSARGVHAATFHPTQPWALLACGPQPGSYHGAELIRYEPASEQLAAVYEGPPGAGDFTTVAFVPSGTRAVAGTGWGQLVELSSES